MQKRTNILAAAMLLGLVMFPQGNTVKAGVVFDSLSASTSGNGFINPDYYFGNAVSLSSSSATITSLTFNATMNAHMLYSGYTATPSYQAFFYSLNPGADGQYLTADDKFGSLLGSSTVQTFSVPDEGARMTLDGFSVNVPQHFAWVLSNSSFSSILASVVTVAGSDYSNIQGGSVAPATEYWSSSAPVEGGSFDMLGNTGTNENWAVQLSGTVPEPATMSLLALGGMAVLLKRRRKVVG